MDMFKRLWYKVYMNGTVIPTELIEQRKRENDKTFIGVYNIRIGTDFFKHT